jgi:hypothetical protein
MSPPCLHVELAKIKLSPTPQNASKYFWPPASPSVLKFHKAKSEGIITLDFLDPLLLLNTKLKVNRNVPVCLLRIAFCQQKEMHRIRRCGGEKPGLSAYYRRLLAVGARDDN